MTAMANNWAIVVGINQYKFLPQAPLKFAVADALAMRSFLCEEAGFKPEQVLLCGDGGEEFSRDASRATLRDIVLHDVQRAQKADNLWFFFSGHGIDDHLMPIDGNSRDVKDTAISIHFVTDCLRKCKARNIVMILDMCRNESRDVGRKNVPSIETEIRDLVKQRDGQQGIITLFSCSHSESSYEIADLKQGAFTYALLEGLRSSQTTVKNLEDHLVKRVPELHESAGKVCKQVPLVIPEPGWKYDEPILSSYATAMDVTGLNQKALLEEVHERFDKAKRLFRQVAELASVQIQRRDALDSIDRINNKIARQKPIPDPKLIDEQSPKTRRDIRVLNQEGLKLRDRAWELLDQEFFDNYTELCDNVFFGELSVSAVKRVLDNQPVKTKTLRLFFSGLNDYLEQDCKFDEKSHCELDGRIPIINLPIILPKIEDQYIKLQELLKNKQWNKADGETHRIMNDAIGTTSLVRALKNYPQDTIETIDRLWADASGEKFGFFAQARIWQKVNRDKSEFEIQVGWRRPNAARAINQSQLKLNLEEAEVGHFPAFFKSWGGGGWSFTEYLLDRISEFLDSIDVIFCTSKHFVEYQDLSNLLKKKQWKSADISTFEIMLKVTNREGKRWLDIDSLRHFPISDLQIIDKLWLTASNGKFGFSVQAKMWEEYGSSTEHDLNWKRFGQHIGWCNESKWNEYGEIDFHDEKLPKGHLPGLGMCLWGIDGKLVSNENSIQMSPLFMRVRECEVEQ